MTKLPMAFVDLQEFADEFAISDDLKRDLSEASASREKKHELVTALWPHLEAINAFLDQHDDESAHLLGRLAEAACEFALEVGWPKEVRE